MMLGDQVYSKIVFQDFYIRMTFHLIEKGIFYFPAGFILMVQYPVFRMPAFLGQVKLS